MTRVNTVPVEELTDQHLIAEYRELPMVHASLMRTLNSPKGIRREKISKRYTLNSGHVYFFYDKGQFLRDRYRQVVKEMRRRGFKPDRKRKFPVHAFRNNNLFNSWEIDDHAVEVNRSRINDKVSQKPHWYRKTKPKK